jgi:hypothetical protein
MMLAIVLAYGLALQAIAAGIAGGLHTAPAQGIALQALCAPGHDGSDEPGAPGHDHVSLCCILGCGASPLASGPDRIFVRAPIRSAAVVVAASPTDQLSPTPNPRPLGARAPPVLA